MPQGTLPSGKPKWNVEYARQDDFASIMTCHHRADLMVTERRELRVEAVQQGLEKMYSEAKDGLVLVALAPSSERKVVGYAVWMKSDLARNTWCTIFYNLKPNSVEH